MGNSVQVKALETLGHASHHLAYFDSDSRGIFQGDAAGIYFPKLDVTIPTAPAPFHFEATLASLQKLAQLQPKWLYYTHYGPVDNAVERIHRYTAQLQLWANVVSEAVKRGDTLESIHQQILEKDPQMKTAIDFINKHLLLRKGVLMQNIHGYTEYFKKKLLA